MLFEGRASNWALTKLEIENLGIEVPFQINGMMLIVMKEGMTCDGWVRFIIVSSSKSRTIESSSGLFHLGRPVCRLEPRLQDRSAQGSGLVLPRCRCIIISPRPQTRQMKNASRSLFPADERDNRGEVHSRSSTSWTSSPSL